MKTVNRILVIIVLLSVNTFTQNASDYFPDQTGFKWLYRVVPLDSLNSEIDSLTFFRADSFASVSNYEGKIADILVSKTGPEISLPFQPYTDSLFFNFENTNMSEYVRVNGIINILSQIDSVLNDSIFSFLDFFRTLEDWYSVYRFAQPVNNQYTIFSKDTTITIQSQSVPLRFKYLGKRLDDESIQTEIGNFDCKKFVITRGISYLIILPPPLPPVEIPILFFDDTLWIAQGNWIVKSFMPSANVDLSLLGIGSFYIPGIIMDIQEQVVFVEGDDKLPESFTLFQNYPNPFNPSTTISFNLNKADLVKLEIFDVLGNKIETLVNKFLQQGNYSFTFNSQGLSSGIYYYRLTSGNFMSSKKMTILK